MEDIFKNWMDFALIGLLITGLLFGVLAPSAFISYAISLISGLLAGRVIFARKHKARYPFLVIILAFFVGYMLGVYYGDKRVIALLFILGCVIGYKLYDKKILSDSLI